MAGKTSKKTVKPILLAGGKGTRIAEESNTRPKPMVEIGTQPILWHIMKLYASFGVTEFIGLRWEDLSRLQAKGFAPV